MWWNEYYLNEIHYKKGREYYHNYNKEGNTNNFINGIKIIIKKKWKIEKRLMKKLKMQT